MPPLPRHYLTDKDAAWMHAVHAGAFAQAWDEISLRDMLAVPGTFALAANAQGFILCRSIYEQCEVLTLAVTPGAQRKGLGTNLVEQAKDEACKRGAKRMFLEVSENNVPALRLYAKTGFSILSRRKDYYKNADGSTSDAVVMAYDLK